MDQINVRRADLGDLVDRSFPSYRGRKFSVKAATKVTLFGLNWSGGTRYQYVFLPLSGGDGLMADNMTHPWHNAQEGRTVELPPGFVCVENCVFMGKNLGIRVHAHPENMPKFLPQPH